MRKRSGIAYTMFRSEGQKGRCMMTAKMWLQLILISMGILIGHILGTVLMDYLMAWRDNRKNQVKKG